MFHGDKFVVHRSRGAVCTTDRCSHKVIDMVNTLQGIGVCTSAGHPVVFSYFWTTFGENVAS